MINNYLIDAAMAIIIVNDDNGRPEYIGEAAPGTATSATGWRIKKIIYDGAIFDEHIQWASGNANKDKIMDDYDTYTYS